MMCPQKIQSILCDMYKKISKFNKNNNKSNIQLTTYYKQVKSRKNKSKAKQEHILREYINDSHGLRNWTLIGPVFLGSALVFFQSLCQCMLFDLLQNGWGVKRKHLLRIWFGSYFAWFSDLALKRQRYILLVVGVIAMSDDNNESGDDDVVFVVVYLVALVHWLEWCKSSCAKVLFVSSFGIAVDTVVLSLRLYTWAMHLIWFYYVQNTNTMRL